MPIQQAEKTDYRLVLVLPESRKILALSGVDGYRLPSLGVQLWTRPTQQLREAIETIWNLHTLILDYLEGPPICAVAEVLIPSQRPDLKAVSLEHLHTTELSEEQRAVITLILGGSSPEGSPFARIGWIYEAIVWLESETGRQLSSTHSIEQYNAGGRFTLVQFHMEENCDFWLKATGEPNAHELSMTMCLSKLCGSYLPDFISSKPEWNAWLMSGKGTCVAEVSTAPFQTFTLLEDAVECMAKLQIKTQRHRLALLNAGAFDQRLQVFTDSATELFDYIEEAMSLQTSTRAPRLEKRCIQRLLAVFKAVCQRVEHLGIPDTVVHGDMNRGNILVGGRNCQFIDWSEAYLGNPLITLQHLLLLNQVQDSQTQQFINLLLRKRYRDVWALSQYPEPLEEGFVYMPILAAVSALYGRGDWLHSPRRNDPRRQSYARTLARHMHLASHEPSLLEALCH
jgi:hypothetical protein